MNTQVLYVARDMDGRLYLYEAEPIRDSKGNWRVAYASSCIKLDDRLFPEIDFISDPVKVTIKEICGQ